MQEESFSKNTNANVGGNSANIDIGHVLLLDDVLQAGLRELLVVKEGGVGVDIGVGALAWNSRSDLCMTHRKCLRGEREAFIKIKIFSKKPLNPLLLFFGKMAPLLLFFGKMLEIFLRKKLISRTSHFIWQILQHNFWTPPPTFPKIHLFGD